MTNVPVSADEFELFCLLKKAGVFDVRNGQAVLNFDANGTLVEIECKVKTYKAGKDIIPIFISLRA